MTETKIRYFRDPQTSDRVFTIATRVVGSTLFVGYAICKPETVQVSTWKGLGEIVRGTDVTVYRGDQFEKKIGREIATGRLEKRPIAIPIQENTSVIETLLCGLANEKDVPNCLNLAFHGLWLKRQARKYPRFTPQVSEHARP